MNNRTHDQGSLAFGLLVFLLVILGVAFMAQGLSRSRQPPMPPAQQSYPDDVPAPSPAPAPTAMEPSQPIRLRIPYLNIDTPITKVGLNRDGTPGAPEGANANKAAWLTTSPTPGSGGSSVIVGHVQTRGGPSIFFNLGKLKPGQKIYVVRRDGDTALFDVVAVQAFDKNAIPSDTVYAMSGDPELRLITCGGNWDSRHREFTQNIIAHARFSGSM